MDYNVIKGLASGILDCSPDYTMDRDHNCYFGMVRSILTHFELELINLDFAFLLTTVTSTQAKTHLSCNSTLALLERFATSLATSLYHLMSSGIHLS